MQFGINKHLYIFFKDYSPGQTIEQSWIPHATLVDVNVEVVAKHYPTLLDEFNFNLTQNLKIWRSVMLLELFEDGKNVFKRGKTKEWLRERVEKGMFFARYIRA